MAIFLSVAILFFSSNLFAAEVVGAVTASLGTSYVTRAGAAERIVVKRGADTHFMDTYQTEAKSRLKILFEDDSIISMGENSKLMITENIYDPNEKKRSTVVKMVGGSMRVMVGKAFAGGKTKFEVHTPTSVAAARGTYFIVWVQESLEKPSSGVLVLEGEVAVSPVREEIVESLFSDEKGVVLLGPGQTVLSFSGGEIGAVENASLDLIALMSSATEVSDSINTTELAVAEGEVLVIDKASFLSSDFWEENTPQTEAGKSEEWEESTKESDEGELVGSSPGGDTPYDALLTTPVEMNIPVR